jgi:bud emergence protein 1
MPRSGSQSSLSIPAVNGKSGGRHSNPRIRSPIYRPEEDPYLPPGRLTSLSVPSFHNESGNYWFRLQVTFLPDNPAGPGYTLTLYRTYEDFYEFQITLLDTFPYEAGRQMDDRPGSADPERILPYMPGPVEEDIDDELTEYRREELDAYVKALVELGDRGKENIIRHELFRAFFAAKNGDYCEEVPRTDGGAGVEGVEELDERMGGMRVKENEYENRNGVWKWAFKRKIFITISISK